MNIAAEKAMIIQRFNDVHDIALIKAIKNLLDFGISKQTEYDALEASIQRGIQQSINGEVRPHKEVWTEIRNRYKA